MVLTGSRVDAKVVDQVNFDGGCSDEFSDSLHAKENSVRTVGGWRWARQEVGATSTHRGTGSRGAGSRQQDFGTATMTCVGGTERVSGGRWENAATTAKTTQHGAYGGEARTALGQ
jgi:hypothetical protein